MSDFRPSSTEVNVPESFFNPKRATEAQAARFSTDALARFRAEAKSYRLAALNIRWAYPAQADLFGVGRFHEIP
ncbi:MAG: hypothetical protein AAGU24_00505 [Dehalogenimonas sp.]